MVGDDAIVAGTLARLRPAPGVPRRPLPPAEAGALSTLPTSSAGEPAVATVHAHGYSLQTRFGGFGLLSELIRNVNLQQGSVLWVTLDFQPVGSTLYHFLIG